DSEVCEAHYDREGLDLPRKVWFVLCLHFDDTDHAVRFHACTLHL
ncbi:MAG: hypothetical protein AVDCRST_MAG93-6328, partial [uncultured Chloroflexia bacterium]